MRWKSIRWECQCFIKFPWNQWGNATIFNSFSVRGLEQAEIWIVKTQDAYYIECFRYTQHIVILHYFFFALYNGSVHDTHSNVNTEVGCGCGCHQSAPLCNLEEDFVLASGNRERKQNDVSSAKNYDHRCGPPRCLYVCLSMCLLLKKRN